VEVFKVISKGVYTTIQDLGRYGYRNFGVPVSGGIDREALIFANTILGNNKNEPVLETLASGLELLALNEVVIAITGAKVNVVVDNTQIKYNEKILIKKNQTLYIKELYDGIRTYIAIEGGFLAPKIMGSYSVNEKITIGKAIANGDILYKNNKEGKIPNIKRNKKRNRKIFHVYIGPDEKNFTKKGMKTFFSNKYTVSNEVSKMGMRLKSKAIEHIDTADVLSHPVVFGCVQVTSNGQAIILLSDCQTIGGYSVIASIINKDLSKLGQLKPGDVIKFKKYKF